MTQGSPVSPSFRTFHGVLGTFALSAVLTPPDVITQVLLAVPLYGLYEFGMVVSRFFEDPKNREIAIRQMQAEAEVRCEAEARCDCVQS